jgi:hypothetical protein
MSRSEGKLKCRRCEIFGVDCDGYVNPKSKVPVKRPPPTPILPRKGAEGEVVPQVIDTAK